MKPQRISLDFGDTGLLPPLVSGYLGGDAALKDMAAWSPSAASILPALEKKRNQRLDRAVLVEALHRQYAALAGNGYEGHPRIEAQIDSFADDNTFCITTGHQLCLFGGPLYFVYKIFSVIGLADRMNRAHPGCRFVPVFWMASEDHDLDEINHVHVFGKRIEWPPPQAGAAGRLPLAGIGPVLDRLREILGEGEHAAALDRLFRDTYRENESLAGATRRLVHAIAGRYGVVVVDGDDPALKRQFAAVMRADLLEQTPFRLVSASSETLAARYAVQVHPREINLFLLDEGIRQRIVRTEGGFAGADTGVAFSEAELLGLLEKHPERFSPNVVLRPLYQEAVLPGVAYVGGPAEVSYWLQYRKMFDHFGIAFPVVLLRSLVLWLDPHVAGRLGALGLEPTDAVRPADDLIREYLGRHGDGTFELTSEAEDLKGVFARIRERAAGDESLVKAVGGEEQKALNQLKALEGKLVRAEKRRHETAVRQITALKERLFPGGVPQERHDHFAPMYLRSGEAFFDFLAGALDPSDARLQIVVESENQ